MKTLTKIQSAAIDLYKPPFKFECGYIFDSEHNMLADNGGMDELMDGMAARIRGWGRIQYLKDFKPEELQDTVGELVAIALTEYWEKHVNPNSDKEE